MKPKITVVTVCFNADKVISETLESIVNQDYSDFELVIKDGASTDMTMDIIEDYKKKLEERLVPVNAVSSQDKGIYDAMNCSVQMAAGDWIIFMNAGDCFANIGVLKKVAEVLELDASFAYGDTIDRLNGYYKYSPAGDVSELSSRMPTSHQSVFARRSYMLSHPFNQQYKYAADYDMLLRAYMSNEKFQRLKFPIAYYSRDGVSEINFKAGADEMKKIQQTYGLKTDGEFKRKYMIYRVWLRSLVRKYFPRLYFSKKRGWEKE